MNPKPFYLIAVLLLSNTINLKAQTDTASVEGSVNTLHFDTKNVQQKPGFNFIKLNFLGIVLKNYQIQFERVLSRKISVAVAYRTMPSTTLPFKNQILKATGTVDPDTKETIEKLRISNFAITPEIRFYLSKKGYGQGLYIAPFYRYAGFTTNNMVFTFVNSSNTKNTIDLSGKLTSNTGGILLGLQKFIGKYICIDTWLLGPHYGSGKGNFSGVSSMPLSQFEQDNLKQQLENIDIPLTNKTVSVSANGASVKLDGPWGGVRVGVSIGVRF